MSNATIKFAILLLCGSTFAQTPANEKFDGKWWLSADLSERSGFIDGFSDCAVWAAHDLAFNETPEQVVDKITDFYRGASNISALPVKAAWTRVNLSSTSARIASGGETWRNPHWYLNGDWWLNENAELHNGYVEGYQLCMKNEVHSATDNFSHTATHYSEQIDHYLKAHPKSGKEFVAVILRRYRDKPTSTKIEE